MAQIADQTTEPLLRYPAVAVTKSDGNATTSNAAPSIQRRASGSARRYQMNASMRSNGSATSELASSTTSPPSSPLRLLLKNLCLCGRQQTAAQLDFDQLQRAHERAKRVSCN
ncbi:hypothetical protein M3Y98_00231000 [Aphelenchoides besseyi]|nr:hypothetical protein M3Y98_00231000 [Aphelenchoides besseyi]